MVSRVLLIVLTAFQLEGDTFTTVKVLSGEVDVGMVLGVESTGARWRIVGLGYISVDADKKGIRVLSLEGLDENLLPQQRSLLQQVLS